MLVSDPFFTGHFKQQGKCYTNIIIDTSCFVNATLNRFHAVSYDCCTNTIEFKIYLVFRPIHNSEALLYLSSEDSCKDNTFTH